jgi:hypothetical protein
MILYVRNMRFYKYKIHLSVTAVVLYWILYYINKNRIVHCNFCDVFRTPKQQGHEPSFRHTSMRIHQHWSKNFKSRKLSIRGVWCLRFIRFCLPTLTLQRLPCPKEKHNNFQQHRTVMALLTALSVSGKHSTLTDLLSCTARPNTNSF